MQNYKQEIFFGALSGLLMGSSYIPIFPWAILFCYIPVWYFCAYRAKNFKSAFLVGLSCQVVMTLVMSPWVAVAAHEYWHLNWILSIIILISYSLISYLYIPTGCVLLWYLVKQKNKSLAQGLLFVVLFWTLNENIWPQIFSFHISDPLIYQQLSIIQWADVIGFQGLSFLLYLSQAYILYFYMHLLWVGRAVAISLLFVFCFLLSYLGGKHLENWYESINQKPVQKLGVVMVQANISSSYTDRLERRQLLGGYMAEVQDQYFKLTTDAVQNFLGKYQQHPDAVIWPENAYPTNLNLEQNADVRKLFDYVRNLNLRMVLGAYYQKTVDGRSNLIRDYNGLFVIEPNVIQLQQPYLKQQLFIFGEYFPLQEFLFADSEMMARGQDLSAKNIAGVQVSTQICYEGLDANQTANSILLGADLLLNISNDSLFGKTKESLQHFYLTAERAIENRRPLLRVASTGVSGVVLADGKVIAQSNAFEPWVGLEQVEYVKNAEITFFTKYQKYYNWIIGALLIVIVLI